jgi:dihydropyrimidinase
MFDLGIMNGRLWLDGGWISANLYVENGKIAAVSASVHPAAETLDAKGMLVMPGFIDPHVHFALKVGETVSADDFGSGSRAAAFGGVTTVIDFLDPVKTAAELGAAFEARSILAKKASVDWGFHATVANPTEPPERLLKAALDRGIPSVKLFTAYSSTDRRTPDRYIDALLAASAETGTTVLVHAENESLIDARSGIPLADHEKSRPASCETTEVLTLAELARSRGGRLYIVHVSAGSTVGRVRALYPELLGKSLFLESCPHYFAFSSSRYEHRDGALFAMTPPLRSETERRLLAENFDAIATIGTDHCPYDRQAKMQPTTDRIPMGIGGIEFSFTTMYDLFGDAAIDRFTKNPARIHGLWPRKGSLQPGSDADIVVFDPGAHWIVGGHHGASDYTPYAEREMTGRVTATIRRGVFLFRDGEFHPDPGVYLERTAAPVRPRPHDGPLDTVIHAIQGQKP